MLPRLAEQYKIFNFAFLVVIFALLFLSSLRANNIPNGYYVNQEISYHQSDITKTLASVKETFFVYLSSLKHVNIRQVSLMEFLISISHICLKHYE